MPEVPSAPLVITGDQAVTNGVVVIGDRTVDRAGAAPTAVTAAPTGTMPHRAAYNGSMFHRAGHVPGSGLARWPVLFA